MGAARAMGRGTGAAGVARGAGLGLALLALGGCGVAGPTYGTDKSVGEQLIEDLASVTTLRKETVQIDYKPRPGLVPAPDGAGLPAPQERLSERDEAWRNSPEELRRRLAAEARGTTASPLRNVDTRSVAAQSKLYDPEAGKRINMQKRAARIGPAGQRRLLSDPPLEYRQAATTAPYGDLGVPEYKKQRERARAARDGGRSWRDILPF